MEIKFKEKITLCRSDFATCLLRISNESNFRLHNKQVRRLSSINDGSFEMVRFEADD